MTKKYKKAYILLLIISIILNLFPVLFYTFKAFLSSAVIIHKVTLCSTIFISIILSAISMLTKVNIRSTLWILIIGLYVCLDSIMNMIIFIAVFQVVDEIIITPIKKSVKQRLVINKELDKRL